MNTKSPRTVLRALLGSLAAVAIAALAACSTTDHHLFTETEPPQLRDGEVRMTSDFVGGGRADLEERLVSARAGVVNVSLETENGHWEGTATPDEWQKLWHNLDAAAPWRSPRLGVDADDMTGGPYHTIQLRVEEGFYRFSAQHKTDLGVFTSRGVQDRLGLSNAIVDFVGDHATHQTRRGPAPGSKAESRAASRPVRRRT